MRLIQYRKGEDAPEIRKKIAELEAAVWPESGEEAFPAAPETHAASFILEEGETAVCHVGVRSSILFHRGQRYTAYGLSEVATRQGFRNRGLASRLIREASQFIMDQNPDLSVFTCAPDKVSLYSRGGWEAAEGVCLVGGTREAPFRSDGLGLVTMIRLISPRAKRRKADFENTDLVLELGKGRLW